MELMYIHVAVHEAKGSQKGREVQAVSPEGALPVFFSMSIQSLLSLGSSGFESLDVDSSHRIVVPPVTSESSTYQSSQTWPGLLHSQVENRIHGNGLCLLVAVLLERCVNCCRVV